MVDCNELHDHQIACPHGPCGCTEAGCDFAASPAALVVHLRDIHSIPVDMIPYGANIAFIKVPLLPAALPKIGRAHV